jgi:hypothetical protein
VELGKIWVNGKGKLIAPSSIATISTFPTDSLLSAMMHLLNTVNSSKGFPAICNPLGSPDEENPPGMEIAGSPGTLKGPVRVASYLRTPSPQGLNAGQPNLTVPADQGNPQE